MGIAPAAAVLLLSVRRYENNLQRGVSIAKHRPLLPADIVYALSSPDVSIGCHYFLKNLDGISASAWAAAGGLLFLTSDSILAYNRFVKPQPQGQLKTHITYHLGQVGLIAGALTWFLSQH